MTFARSIRHDLTGKTRRTWRIVEHAGFAESGVTLWRCRCMRCGFERVTPTAHLREDYPRIPRCPECDGGRHRDPIGSLPRPRPRLIETYKPGRGVSRAQQTARDAVRSREPRVEPGRCTVCQSWRGFVVGRCLCCGLEARDARVGRAG
jgi:hypothetical protein